MWVSTPPSRAIRRATAWLQGHNPNRAARVICADIQTAATRVVAAWAVAMPVAASQLVLTVAAEDRALVGAVGWAATLPLAASGVALLAAFRPNFK